MRRIGIIALLLALATAAKAQDHPMHPAVPLLDEGGVSVLSSGGAVSPSRSCGSCHDTGFIRTHSFHVCAGLRQMAPPGEIPGGRSWDTSPGLFGRWNPLFYRYLTPQGDARLDLGTAEWIQTMGQRHVGFGPARYARDMQPLTSKAATDRIDPETWILDAETGAPHPWDWQKSGIVDMNCFLCHLPQPATAERNAELAAGRFRWAATATLANTGLVEQTSEGWRWNPSLAGEDGRISQEVLPVGDPESQNCGQCHGLVHLCADPLMVHCNLWDEYETETSGRVFSGQRIGASGLNLHEKDTLNRAWDVHAERAVSCIQCHHALNHPGLYNERPGTRPSHLAFDPRTQEMGTFLHRPHHNFAKGHVSQYPAASLVRGTVRRCEDCHDFASRHRWLPHAQRHIEKMLCEACHVPWVYAPTRQETDWTVLTTKGEPRIAYRGVEGDPCDPRALVVGFEPLLLPRTMADGSTKLAPQNLISSWFWVGGNPPRPVRLFDLQQAYLDEGNYRPEILAALDNNGDGHLGKNELVLDTPEKVTAIRRQLEAVGVDSPEIRGEIQPYGMHHGVAPGEWATKQCEDCHAGDSRLAQSIELARRVPAGVLPKPVGDAVVLLDRNAIESSADGLIYHTTTRSAGIFLPGHDAIAWIDWLGILAVVATLGGIALHSGLRILVAMRSRKES